MLQLFLEYTYLSTSTHCDNCIRVYTKTNFILGKTNTLVGTPEAPDNMESIIIKLF